MPRTTIVRSLRVPAEVWEAAQAKAAEKGTSVNAVLAKALRRYVRTNLAASCADTPPHDTPFPGATREA